MAYIYKQLYLEYLSTTELVRALERARSQVIDSSSTADKDKEYLWTGIANDILQELAARQLRLIPDEPPAPDAPGAVLQFP